MGNTKQHSTFDIRHSSFAAVAAHDGARAARPRCAAVAAAVASLALAVASPAIAELPDAYLDYVESSGTQYIDTGVTGKDGTLMEAEMEWTALTADGENQFCGATTADGVEFVPYLAYQATTHRMRYNKAGAASVQGSGTKPVTGIRYHVVVSMDNGAQTNIIRRIEGGSMPRIYTKSDTLVSDWRALSGPVDTQISLYLFARNKAGTADRFSSARLYSLKLWQKNGSGDYQLVRHFLPCRRNGRAALYDKVNEAIYFPEGGDLDAGSVLPRPAELVEWVQSDGADGDRQLYIDSGVVGKAGVGMVAELMWPVKPSVASTVCGAMADGSNHFTLYTSSGTHQIGYAANSAFQVNSGTVSVYANKRYRISSSLMANAQNLLVEDLDGTGYNGTRFHNDKKTIDSQNALYLFARNDAGVVTNQALVRLYYLVLTNELGVVRDYVPCVADNGKAGLYDRVSERVFFPRAATEGATAEFSLATEVGAITDRTPTTKWPLFRPEWIEANGTNDYVDLGVIGHDGMRMVAEIEWSFIPASAATFCGSATNSSAGLFTTYRVTPDFHRIGYYNGSKTLGGASCAPVANVRYRVETSLANGTQTFSVARQEGGAWVPVGKGSDTFDLSFPAGYADLNLPLYLFARNFNGIADEFAPARLYSFKLWQGGALVRDISPVFDPADNSPALFDKVSKRYFHNDGGYSLHAGGATSAFPGQTTFFVIH